MIYRDSLIKFLIRNFKEACIMKAIDLQQLRFKNLDVLILGAIIFVIVVSLFLLSGRGLNKYVFNSAELANEIAMNRDQISPNILSEWIIDGRADYKLIDIRKPEEFAAGSIKGAVNIPMAKILERKTMNSELSAHKKNILYSNGDSHANQAWLILKAAGKDVYVLEGGFNYWNKLILNPKLSSTTPSDDEVLLYKKAKGVADYLGGSGSADAVQKGEGAAAGKTDATLKKKKQVKGC
jgi:rhodanese-related sulfurtransferase